MLPFNLCPELPGPHALLTPSQAMELLHVLGRLLSDVLNHVVPKYISRSNPHLVDGGVALGGAELHLERVAVDGHAVEGGLGTSGRPQVEVRHHNDPAVLADRVDVPDVAKDLGRGRAGYYRYGKAVSGPVQHKAFGKAVHSQHVQRLTLKVASSSSSEAEGLMWRTKRVRVGSL